VIYFNAIDYEALFIFIFLIICSILRFM